MVVAIDLIDTTEMYLKTVFEMEEDGVTPMRARIVERLGHSGPTVSQTIARMERDGLIWVRGDRRLELTETGRGIANEVMRKHRLAERLLVDVIGLDWTEAHAEACRWEHVMSAAVEERLSALLGDPATDPYGNAIPGSAQHSNESTSLEAATRGKPGAKGRGVVARIGEPIQADVELLREMQDNGVRAGAQISFERVGEDYLLCVDDHEAVALPTFLASHFFVNLR